MARITVDDCLKRIPNRFQLTLTATYRARQLSSGASPLVEPNRDKVTVIALREIAQGKVHFHRDSHEVCVEYIAEVLLAQK